MATPHIEAKKEDISNIVIMSGDPMRSKYIAENFLEDAKLVNKVRGMYAYTGNYKGKKITVMGHGMGMSSIGIYAYELFKFYDVETIIRVGSCGSFNENSKVGTNVLAQKTDTTSNFAFEMIGKDIHEIDAFNEINEIIKTIANENRINIIEDSVTTGLVFDAYRSNVKSTPKNFVDMEAFALFLIAHTLNKKCACLLNVTDNLITDEHLPSSYREQKLNDIIFVALESALRL